MNLTQKQKDVVLAARHGSTLVKIRPEQWAVVWVARAASPRTRWHGQLVHSVEDFFDDEKMEINLKVWWWGGEMIGPTREAVVNALTVEATE